MSDLFKRLWETADEAAPDHPYLLARKIQPNGASQDKAELMIPMSSGGQITGLQFIGEDGTIRYIKGSKVKGSCCKIGEIKKQILPGVQEQAAKLFGAAPAAVEAILDDELPKVIPALRGLIQSAEAPLIAKLDQFYQQGINVAGTIGVTKIDIVLKESK